MLESKCGCVSARGKGIISSSANKVKYDQFYCYIAHRLFPFLFLPYFTHSLSPFRYVYACARGCVRFSQHTRIQSRQNPCAPNSKLFDWSAAYCKLRLPVKLSRDIDVFTCQTCLTMFVKPAWQCSTCCKLNCLMKSTLAQLSQTVTNHPTFGCYSLWLVVKPS